MRVWGRGGFTLVELLIVVAIIAILAAIAVPDFLEAQVRARVSRVRSDLRVIDTGIMAYYIDYNDIGIRDTDDDDTPADLKGLTFHTEQHVSRTDVLFPVTGLSSFYTFSAYRRLTTPIAYISFRPRDAFSTMLPYGCMTRGYFGSDGFDIAYAVVFSSGPDMIACDWYGWSGGSSSPNGRGVLYDATNGTKSRGDIWRCVSAKDKAWFVQEFGENMY